jgi:hypothetical protein
MAQSEQHETPAAATPKLPEAANAVPDATEAARLAGGWFLMAGGIVATCLSIMCYTKPRITATLTSTEFDPMLAACLAAATVLPIFSLVMLVQAFELIGKDMAPFASGMAGAFLVSVYGLHVRGMGLFDFFICSFVSFWAAFLLEFGTGVFESLIGRLVQEGLRRKERQKTT